MRAELLATKRTSGRIRSALTRKNLAFASPHGRSGRALRYVPDLRNHGKRAAIHNDKVGMRRAIAAWSGAHFSDKANSFAQTAKERRDGADTSSSVT